MTGSTEIAETISPGWPEIDFPLRAPHDLPDRGSDQDFSLGARAQLPPFGRGPATCVLLTLPAPSGSATVWHGAARRWRVVGWRLALVRHSGARRGGVTASPGSVPASSTVSSRPGVRAASRRSATAYAGGSSRAGRCGPRRADRYIVTRRIGAGRRRFGTHATARRAPMRRANCRAARGSDEPTMQRSEARREAFRDAPQRPRNARHAAGVPPAFRSAPRRELSLKGEASGYPRYARSTIVSRTENASARRNRRRGSPTPDAGERRGRRQSQLDDPPTCAISADRTRADSIAANMSVEGRRASPPQTVFRCSPRSWNRDQAPANPDRGMGRLQEPGMRLTTCTDPAQE